MKKRYLGMGAVFISLLLISTVTALPQSHSRPAMDYIKDLSEKKASIEAFESSSILSSLKTIGIIDFIIQLIILLIQLVFKLIEFVSNLINIIGLIQNLIDALLTLFDLVQQLIQLIMDVFNPGTAMLQ